MAPLAYGAIPVFADVEMRLSASILMRPPPKSVPRTRAILVTNLFRPPARLSKCEHLPTLTVFFDRGQCARAACGRGRPVCRNDRTYRRISLNYHKHIHTGEGGICTTDDSQLAERLALIRNHGENLVESNAISDITNLIGFNLRLTELSAGSARQLANADRHVGSRVARPNAVRGRRRSFRHC